MPNNDDYMDGIGRDASESFGWPKELLKVELPPVVPVSPKPNEWLDKPDSNGLWWHCYRDEHGNWFSDVFSINLTNPDGSEDSLPITVMGSGEENPTFEDEEFTKGKWQKVIEPIPFE